MLVGLVCGMLTACTGGETDHDSGRTPASPAAPNPTSAPSSGSPAVADANVLSGTFDVGGGRELYVGCAGTGRPTVLLEAGDK